ncbi:DUF4307 domain-containing protein [Georgenia wangjunii]|uniref:DUF4307 domain-containing protein n=1 Tax=Georgenia wangjunii TaxID=3117730 RepID=UPI002F263638
MAEPAPGDARTVRTALDDRYGRDPRRSRRTALVVVGVGALVVLAFVVFAALATNVPVRTQDAGFRVVDEASAEVTFTVSKSPDVVADCTVVALNENFAEVGVATVRVGPDETSVVTVTASVRTIEPPRGARVDGCVVVPG